MPYFDRFDICAAYRQLESDWNIGGILQERASNRRRNASTSCQLARMRYRPDPLGDMTPNAWAIYRAAARRMGLHNG